MGRRWPEFSSPVRRVMPLDTIRFLVQVILPSRNHNNGLHDETTAASPTGGL